MVLPTNFLITLINNALVVRSIDFMFTRAAAPETPAACLKGLKFNMALMILFDIDWRDRIKMFRQFSVAFTSIESLQAH